ncbi:SAF domain-containing protein [Desulfotomaculum nigrificans]|uniref:SAF domain-containing protein n=1 Tax=Desulfotomaculum nigrificans TaxID=1565 RepID=UPI0001FAE598|nr:SAF domain-containing protein [Desulfotomaculum nigrificans]
MSRKWGIITALVIAIVFTTLVGVSSNHKYAAATKPTKVYQAAKFIPQGTTIKESDIKEVDFPESLSSNLIKDKKEIVGKGAVVSMLKDQKIYKGSVSPGAGKRPGFVEILIPTDLSKSALALPGEYVNLIPVDDSGTQPLYVNALVKRSLDNDGNDIDPSTKNTLIGEAKRKKFVPVSIGVDIPPELQTTVAKLADQKKIYLVKSDYIPDKK